METLKVTCYSYLTNWILKIGTRLFSFSMRLEDGSFFMIFNVSFIIFMKSRQMQSFSSYFRLELLKTKYNSVLNTEGGTVRDLMSYEGIS